jgi:hypothetical protein
VKNKVPVKTGNLFEENPPQSPEEALTSSSLSLEGRGRLR